MNSGDTHIAIRGLFEYAREELKLPLNNSHSPYVSRRLIAEVPGMKGLIETRALGGGAPHAGSTKLGLELQTIGDWLTENEGAFIEMKFNIGGQEFDFNAAVVEAFAKQEIDRKTKFVLPERN